MYTKTGNSFMARQRHDPNSKIIILRRDNPANVGTRLHAGYNALAKHEGKTYQEFRDVVGTKPQRPNNDDRVFSPADTIRHAIDNGYVELISSEEENPLPRRKRIPTATKNELLDAMEKFDLSIRRSKEMLDWENNAAHKYAINHDGRLYPVKKIIALATDLSVSNFSGGWGRGQANEFVEQHGFSIVDLKHSLPDTAVESKQTYPLKSYSWVMYSPTVAVKQMDKSAFLHHGTGVPRDISFYFDFKPDDEAKAVWLVHADKRYEAHLSPDVENQRVRLFWQSPFSELIEGLMPGRHTLFSTDDEQSAPSAEMRFVKEGDDVYSVDFLEPEAIKADAENPDDEPSATTARKEGAAKTVTSVQYERDPQNRLDAIRIHGHRCVACGFDFGEVYGDRGEGYIEVHHLVPLHDAEDGHEVNPETDLAPVCANCHRMIHRRRDSTLSIDELRELLQSQIGK
jgi:hypothetical protein